MNVREKFENFLSDNRYLREISEATLSHAEDVFEDLPEEELMRLKIEDVQSWVLEKGLEAAISRLQGFADLSGDKIEVYRGLAIDPDEEIVDDAIYAKETYGSSARSVSYTVDFNIAKTFAGKDGAVVKAYLGEDDIHWDHLLYLLLAHPQCSEYEKEIPATLRPRKVEIVWGKTIL